MTAIPVDTTAAAKLLGQLERGVLPPESVACALVHQATAVLAKLPTLVEIDLPAGSRLHVVGDLHGQYSELLKVLAVCGWPASRQNYFIFNGDFVDRGNKSVEVMLALLALLAAHPGTVFLNRGNHETQRMNQRYGFYREVLEKYSKTAYVAFLDSFRQLPLATLVNKAALVLHGGLFSHDGVSLADVASIDRRQDDFTQGLAQDLLWSDPTSRPGRFASPRGAGVHFGPDVTKRFCAENGLQCCIRSHEMVPGGYVWQAGAPCVTVFSAANYCGHCGNLGAVCHISPSKEGRLSELDLSFSTFSATDALAHTPPRSRL
mmetsp:Transcript_31865/g.62733  ORF Transcript_31865/g.62733 Transcript_31865/m.62733 type:complete len:319 (-) Transcript_31865:189-1145(-)